MTVSVAPTAREKFQALLWELFQFDRAELDFGIYRIMNHKRAVVDDFIVNTLPANIDAALNQGPLVGQAQAEERREAAARQVRENLGKYVINRQGELDIQFQDTPAGRAYLAAQADAASGRSRAAVETEIYNHLYAFFRRYYRDGDFIAQRRYSASGDTYAIPYNGQEVFLHWANRDQYYVKTAEHFLNYDWKAANAVKVRFRLDAVDVERNNAKGERRFFLPQASQRQWADAEGILTIPIEYRPLTDRESQEYGGGGARQDKINAAAAAEIIQSLHDNPAALAALTPIPANSALTALETHLRRYAARNNADFFIHKDLGKFLTRELDFYLKNEALKLDTLLAPGRKGESAAVPAAAALQQARLIRHIGGKIIAFLAQLEGFQKSLWEKRKFVTQTAYCITLNAINPSFYPEIAANAAQGQEWRNLGFVDESLSPTPDFLMENPTLPLDTRHFSPDFTDRLLASFANLDAQTDGILIHGDNWQALRLLEETYQGRVQCIYIDPPYNTDASAIIYKNGYKDSTWLSLIADGLVQAKSLLTDAGILCCAIDDEEAWRLRGLMQTAFPRELGIVPVRTNPAGRKATGKFSTCHEYALFYGMDESHPNSLEKTGKEKKRYPFRDELGNYAWGNLIRNGTGPLRADRPTMFYPIYVRDDDTIRVPEMEWDADKGEYAVLEEPTGRETVVLPVRDGVERRWHRGHERIAAQPEECRVRRDLNGITIDFKVRMDEESSPKTWWDDGKYSSANHGAKSLKDFFGENPFSFPKAVGLVEDSIRSAGGDGDFCIIDYFAGSGTTGHAVINLNRQDGARRRFILVEQGEYFDTVLLPRIKKATYAPEWAGGKPKRRATAAEAERSPRIVKYLRLESYEDALDSVDFDERAGELALEQFGEEYLLKYLLNWETKDSPTKLKTADLATPFCYRLRGRERGKLVNRKVDLGETFNWLLGLRVQSRQVYQRDGRRYLVYRGEIRAEPGQLAAVIWRETAGWTEGDYAADRAFIIEQQLAGGAAILYLNSGAAAPQAGSRPIEPLFKARMFAGVTAR